MIDFNSGSVGKAPVTKDVADGNAPEVTFQPHTAVMYSKEEAATDAEAESKPLCLASQVMMDSMSLPGTPVSTTDGSSYSSTSSGHNLLVQQSSGSSPGKSSSDEEKPTSKWDRRAAGSQPENC